MNIDGTQVEYVAVGEKYLHTLHTNDIHFSHITDQVSLYTGSYHGSITSIEEVTNIIIICCGKTSFVPYSIL